MNPALKTAFKYHRETPAPYGEDWTGRNAELRLMKARQDVAAGKDRYPAYSHRPVHQRDGLTYLGDRPEDFGLRFVGHVKTEPGGYSRHFTNDSRRNGWYADAHQHETCAGVVYQLPASNGESRYVAGYDFSDRDGGLVFDLKTVFTEQRRGEYYGDSPEDIDAARAAARHADSLAKDAAESERDYSTAWAAGNQWRDLADSIAETKAELRELLARCLTSAN